MMTQSAHIVLEDGSAYRGVAFGDTSQSAHGEVVFNTSMTGYQEILTDPSYAGQIVVPTYPLIGNYGINRQDFESRRIQVSGFVVREHCDAPSHSASEMTLDEFLRSQGVLGNQRGRYAGHHAPSAEPRGDDGDHLAERDT